MSDVDFQSDENADETEVNPINSEKGVAAEIGDTENTTTDYIDDGIAYKETLTDVAYEEVEQSPAFRDSNDTPEDNSASSEETPRLDDQEIANTNFNIETSGTSCNDLTNEMQYLSFNPFHNQSFEASTIEPDTDNLEGSHKDASSQERVQEISQSIGFVADNINQLLQESNSHKSPG